MMIDLHTHLLPNIDDGASSVEEAMEMTRLLSEQKVQIAVCTPHFIPSQTALSDFLAARQYAMTRMNRSEIRMIAGSETMLHEYLFHYPDISELCIADTRYLLLEMPFTKHWDNKVFEQMDKLINYYNIIPIIAHIERYPSVRRNDKPILKLIELGCVLQLNTASLLDQRSSHRAIRYLKRGYISVLGSDCHNTNERQPRITTALDVIHLKVGDSTVSKLIKHAEFIIKDELLPVKPT
jgi:protein-tyrosine phosphatase